MAHDPDANLTRIGLARRPSLRDIVVIEVYMMTATVGVRDARARFSELLDRASRGESISITRRGAEIARLVPGRQPTERRPGRMKGRIWMAPDFDATPPEVQAAIDDDLEPK